MSATVYILFLLLFFHLYHILFLLFFFISNSKIPLAITSFDDLKNLTIKVDAKKIAISNNMKKTERGDEEKGETFTIGSIRTTQPNEYL
jgi:hypothetical protein